MPALSPIAALTTPERRLLMLLASGRTSTEAASVLHLTPCETEAMLESLLHRHGVKSRHQLCMRALVHRWI